MTKQDRIAQLLAQGMKPSMIAGIVGVTAPYISQLAADQDFKEHVAALITELAEEDAEGKDTRARERIHYVDTLAAAEHKVLDQILTSLQYMSGREQIAALDTIGKRRDAMEQQQARQSGAHGLGGEQATVRFVEITMPAICIPELQMGPNREILGIGDRSIAPMNTSKLNDLLATVTQGETYDEHDYSAL